MSNQRALVLLQKVIDPKVSKEMKLRVVENYIHPDMVSSGKISLTDSVSESYKLDILSTIVCLCGKTGINIDTDVFAKVVERYKLNDALDPKGRHAKLTDIAYKSKKYDFETIMVKAGLPASEMRASEARIAMLTKKVETLKSENQRLANLDSPSIVYN